MPDTASLDASPAPPASAPTSVPHLAPVDGARRYEVQEVMWGIHKRFVVRDTATDTTIAIRASRLIADSDLLRLNLAVRAPRTGSQPVSNDAPAELIADPPAERQCGRCRQFFASEANPNPAAGQDWWLCGPCHDKLMGTGARTGNGPVGAAAGSGSSSTASAGPTPALTGRTDVG